MDESEKIKKDLWNLGFKDERWIDVICEFIERDRLRVVEPLVVALDNPRDFSMQQVTWLTDAINKTLRLAGVTNDQKN